MGLNTLKESHAMLEPALVVRAMSIISQVEHIDVTNDNEITILLRGGKQFHLSIYTTH